MMISRRAASGDGIVPGKSFDMGRYCSGEDTGGTELNFAKTSQLVVLADINLNLVHFPRAF